MRAKFLASSDPAALAATNPHITIEAEYGDAVVKGSALTMAHHGPRAGGKCPAAYSPAEVSRSFIGAVYDEHGDEYQVDNTPHDGPVVGLSHFDLDTLGGCLAVLGAAPGPNPGFKPGSASFWRLAEHVDVNGPHRVSESPDATPENLAVLHAFWAWSAKNRGPRVGPEVVDMTGHVLAAGEVLRDLFPATSPTDFPEDDPQAVAAEEQWARRAALLAAGREFMAAEAQLRASSFVRQRGSVVLRRAPAFVNHLYPASPGAAVIAFNETTGAVTVSFADGAASPVSAVEVVQSLWGPLAGGHRGIAGSPRGQAMTFADAEKAFELVAGPEGCDYHGKWAEAECPDCRRTWEW